MSKTLIPTSSTEGIRRIHSCNEWDPLQEIIIGNPKNARIPSLDEISQQNFDRPDAVTDDLKQSVAMPAWLIEETQEDIEDLSATLQSFGIRTHQADAVDSSSTVTTSLWSADQENSINIRDMTLIHGQMVIDAPSPTRGRAFERLAVSGLLNTYRNAGGTAWLHSPPRPTLPDATYDLSRPRGINELEPLFDAANCVRLGRDIIIDINNTANRCGARWLRQAFDNHYGPDEIRIHQVSLSPDHMDVIIIPLCEGVAVINPQYVDRQKLPCCISDWEIIEAPEMVGQPFFTPTPKASNWIGLNMLVINGDEKTVVVEERQLPLIRTLERHGFQPVPARWRHGRSWGGGFHCVTLDIHREGRS